MHAQRVARRGYSRRCGLGYGDQRWRIPRVTRTGKSLPPSDPLGQVTYRCPHCLEEAATYGGGMQPLPNPRRAGTERAGGINHPSLSSLPLLLVSHRQSPTGSQRPEEPGFGAQPLKAQAAKKGRWQIKHFQLEVQRDDWEASSVFLLPSLVLPKQ